ncbi:MAG: hypothetical protein JWQ38_1063 [Flavipsychrobacter sp.]|nr:hypothetical protein [Flavipsychrobacter sp.]
MRRSLFLFSFTLALLAAGVTLTSHAQIWPQEDSKLHYRLIGFSFPPAENSGKYKLQIASGDQKTVGDFEKNIISSVDCKTNKQAAEVPAFGRQYTWRYNYIQGKKETKGELHHFSTTMIPEVDPAFSRLRIIDLPLAFKDNYVFVDGDKTLYDMYGHPVWHLPAIEERASRAIIRDLKLSPFGTITFLLDDRAYEIDYDGHILWKAPNSGAVSGEKTEHYHHEFTRLANGHYMILGMESVTWTNKVAAAHDSTMLASRPGNKVRGNMPVKTTFGTVIEYDKDGNIAWSWKSSKYFIGSDFEDYNPVYKMPAIDVHENSFYFDEKNGFIYVGFKNISRIVKIKYPEGNVVNAYGELYKPGILEQGNGLFCDQHSCRRSEKGYLYLYNNNGCHQGEMPQVVMIQEPAKKEDPVRLVWSYTCNANGVHLNPKILEMQKRQEEARKNINPAAGHDVFMLHPTSGGNVIEMPDQSIFVCMNTEFCKIFIVDQDKQILWNAVPERYNSTEKDWFITPQGYRASIINKTQLNGLLWHEGNK